VDVVEAPLNTSQASPVHPLSCLGLLESQEAVSTRFEGVFDFILLAEVRDQAVEDKTLLRGPRLPGTLRN